MQGDFMKKYIIEFILIALGTGLFTLGFFGFVGCFIQSSLLSALLLSNNYWRHFIRTSIILLPIGAVLIVIGLLLKAKKS